MVNNTKIRILCADDHPLVHDGISFALQFQQDMELVGSAYNGQEALDQFRRLLPDVTLMDLQMPGMGGLEALEAIRYEFPGSRIIVLTTYSGDVRAARAISAGAVGYLLKSSLRTNLFARSEKYIRDCDAYRHKLQTAWHSVTTLTI